jgi:hypothetical protein
MSELGQRLKSMAVPTVDVTIGGERFLLKGMQRIARSQIFADAKTKSGEFDSRKAEGLLLSHCVRDPQTGEAVLPNWEEWDEVPAMVTGPLINQLMKINGMDNDDLGKQEKNSEATSS